MSEPLKPCLTPEICQCCGHEYLTVYRIPDEIWLKIMGKPGGLLCPICCDVLARETKVSLYWEATVEQFPIDCRTLPPAKEKQPK